VVRSLLAMRMEYTRRRRSAASLGQGIAFVLGFIGLFSNPLLVFTAFVCVDGRGARSKHGADESSLSGIPVSRAMVTDFRTVSARDSLAHVVELILVRLAAGLSGVEGGAASRAS